MRKRLAHRRMFAIKIIDSAKFLKMPSSSRLLYYDLGMRADDDGIVEAFNVLRMTGASEDDLKILAAKEYIRILNEDLVTYISDWRESNQLRADRKIDSMYKDLLLQVIPEVELLEAKTRSDRNNKINPKHGTSQGRPSDNQWTEEYRLGQESVGECSVGEVNSSSSESSTEEEELRLIMDYCQKLSFKLKKLDAIQFLEIYGLKKVKQALLTISQTIEYKNNNIKSPSAYLAATLQDLVRDKKVDVTINKAKNKFVDYEQRENMTKEEEESVLGWYE